MEQMTMFELLTPDIKPKIEKGLRVYRTVLDVIESGVVDHIWICDFDKNIPPYYGYSALEDREICINTHFTFWDKDIGSTIFATREESQKRVDSLKGVYEVIEAEDMSIMETIGYQQKYPNGHTAEHCLVLLFGNMIYKQIYGNYPFLYKYGSGAEARSQLGLMKKEIEKNIGGKIERAIIEPELENMYLAQSGIWSSYKYASYNKAKEKTPCQEN